MQVIAKDSNGLVSQRYLLIDVCDSEDNDPEFPTYPNGTVIEFYFTVPEGKCNAIKRKLYIRVQLLVNYWHSDHFSSF